jgi:hypothetical protein
MAGDQVDNEVGRRCACGVRRGIPNSHAAIAVPCTEAIDAITAEKRLSGCGT